PNLGRLAVIVRNDPGLEQRLVDIRAIAGRAGIKVRGFEAATGQALQLAFMWLVNDRSDAVYVASGPLGPGKRAEVIAVSGKRRMFLRLAQHPGLCRCRGDRGGEGAETNRLARVLLQISHWDSMSA